MGYVALNTVDMLTCSGGASDTHLATVGVAHGTGLYQRMVSIATSYYTVSVHASSGRVPRTQEPSRQPIKIGGTPGATGTSTRSASWATQ